MGIKSNQNIKIMDRKVLKDKIDELRSTAKMELACTIREIMREHNVQKKELGWPVVVNNSSLVDIVELGSGDTDIPVFTISVGAGYYKEPHKVGALDDCVSVELLADIATGLNNELSGYVSTYVAKYRFISMKTELLLTWMSLMYSLQNQKEMPKIRQMTMQRYGMTGMKIR